MGAFTGMPSKQVASLNHFRGAGKPHTRAAQVGKVPAGRLMIDIYDVVVAGEGLDPVSVRVAVIDEKGIADPVSPGARSMVPASPSEDITSAP